MRNYPQQGSGKSLFQCLDIFIENRHNQINPICYPPNQLKTFELNRLRGLQRVVEAAQTHAHHHDNGEAQSLGKVGGILSSSLSGTLTHQRPRQSQTIRIATRHWVIASGISLSSYSVYWLCY